MQHLQPNTTLQSGKYRIERMLGQGGFGITYLAVQTSLQRKVAIKEFFMKDYCSRDEATFTMSVPSTGSSKIVEQYRKKFIKEARNLARLNHPNIISVIDVFEESGTVYYVMPYLAGGSLQDYVKAHGTLSEDVAMKYIKQIAGALKYMHEEQHICHYDVKPANILLDDKGNAVLIDFGISKNYDAAGQETTTMPVGMSEGYAPIEQYQQNVEEFSPVSDVYALGATLYFLLHGKRPVSPIHRASGTALLMSKQLSQGIKDMITASMEVSKRERAKSMDVFMKDGCFLEPKTKSFDHYHYIVDDEDTISENSSRHKYTVNFADKKYSSSFWKFVVVVLLFLVLMAGYVLYSNYPKNQIDIQTYTPIPVDTLTFSNTNTQDSYQEKTIIDTEPKQKGSESFVVEGMKGENQVKYRETYIIIVDDGNVSWTFQDANETRKGTFKCNPLVDADVIIAECKSIIYWYEASHYFWFMAEEFGSYRYEEFQLGKKALGLSSSYMGQARKTCPNAFEHVQTMYKNLVNNENGGDLWGEILTLSYALGEHPLEPCDLYDYSFY